MPKTGNFMDTVTCARFVTSIWRTLNISSFAKANMQWKTATWPCSPYSWYPTRSAIATTKVINMLQQGRCTTASEPTSSADATNAASSILQCAIQSHIDIRWVSLPRVQLMQEWREVLSTHFTITKPKLTQHQIHWQTEKCLKTLVRELWKYSKQLWSFRNTAVHGQLQKAVDSKEMKQMKEAAAQHFRHYKEEPTI